MENVKGTALGRGRGRGRGRYRADHQEDADKVLSESILGGIAPSPLRLEASTVINTENARENPAVNQSESSRPQLGRGRGKARNIDKFGDSPVNQIRCDLSPRSEFQTSTDSKVVATCWNTLPQPPNVRAHSSNAESSPQGKQSKATKDISTSLVLKKYFKVPKPSVKRLAHLQTSKVKILKVLEDGDLMVSFQDSVSQHRFSHLLTQMKRYYSTREGWRYTLRELGQLRTGEVVAATVFSGSDICVYRRIKIQIIQRRGKERVRAHGVDIDTLNHWNIWHVFWILPIFYHHPPQARHFKIANYNDMYPKGIFEILFDDRMTFLGVMKSLAGRVLTNILGHEVLVSNITTLTENEENVMAGDINIPLNFRLKELFVEAFCDYFIPQEPAQEDVFYEGMIMDVSPHGIVGISMKNSLCGPIDRILNTVDMHNAYQNVTDKDREELMEKISMRNCKVCLAVDDKVRNRFLRVKIKSVYEGRMRALFMDIGKEVIINSKDLICRMTNNPKIPSILALLPPQALRFQLAGIKYINEELCYNVQQKYGNNIRFKISRIPLMPHDMIEVELFHSSASETHSLNVVLKESKGVF